NLHIHSPGGNVLEGLAMYNLLKNHPAQKIVTIDGIACSMASVIAMTGDRVLMPENAMMMIHKPQGIAGGDANDIRGYADLLDKLEKTLIPAYAAKTGKSEEELSAMLEAETWMNGKECVEHGFADELLAPVKAMAKLESKRIEVMNMPENIKNMIIAPQGNAGKQPENVSEEQKRLSGIGNIFSLSGDRYATLKMQCLEDASCTVEMAKEKLMIEMAKGITPTNQLNGPQNSPAFHAGMFTSNGNITGDAIRQG
ncbi:Clp protease ClpP, partial [Salmonella enterica]|nr:Clp protease ClpP [Salmonella enterica]